MMQSQHGKPKLRVLGKMAALSGSTRSSVGKDGDQLSSPSELIQDSGGTMGCHVRNTATVDEIQTSKSQTRAVKLLPETRAEDTHRVHILGHAPGASEHLSSSFPSAQWKVISLKEEKQFHLINRENIANVFCLKKNINEINKPKLGESVT